MTPRWLVRRCGEEFEWSPLGITPQRGAGSRRGPVSELADAVTGEPVAFVLAAEDVGLRRVAIPARTQAQRIAAAPYAIEDQVADELENLYVTTASTPGSTDTSVGLIAKDLLEDQLTTLREAGVLIAAAIPEMLLLPLAEPGWSVMMDGERMLVRTGACSGFGGEIALVQALIEAHDSHPEVLRVIGTCEDAHVASLRDLTTAAVEHHETNAPPISVLTRGISAGVALDMLPASWRDPHAARNRNRYLQAAAVSFALAAAVYYGVLFWQLDQFEQRTVAVRASQQEVFSAAFPHVRRIVNVTAQARNQLRRLSDQAQAPTPFLDLLHALGSAFAADRQSLDLVTLSYANGSINLTLEAESVAAVEGFNEHLVADAVSAQILSAEPGEDRVRSRVRLSRQ